jgi:predicted ATPase/DNA-binding CsgD family transcriptional regulator
VGVHGFPASLTSFVGRSAEVREVDSLLDQYRLVTVIGPGGAGKTRLAGEIARRVADRYEDGVWLAELAKVRDPARVTSAVAAALGVRALAGNDLDQALARALRGRHLLLVLDNCEHVIGAAARLCSELLLAADEVHILATSREPLKISGEVRCRLGPLPLPADSPDDSPADSPADSPDDSPDGEGDQNPAVTLFTARAREAGAAITLDEQTRPLIARLVARLDGMPLAIELAAGRVEALGVNQLLDRIDDRLALLVSGDRAADDRQRSLAATVEWSYQLLNEQERSVFRALSVFAGPFPLEGAEAVAGPAAKLAVLGMVDCSLLIPPRTGPDGRARYAMPETLRVYGAELLARAGEADAAEAALARFALAVAEEAATGLATRTWESAGLRHMDADATTLEQGLAWAAEHDPVMAVRLALAMSWWWMLRGRMLEHHAVLRAMADRVEPGSDEWYAAHLWLGRVRTDMADPAGALEHYTMVLDDLGDQDRPVILAACLGGRASALLNLGRITEATSAARRSLELAERAGYEPGQATALALLAMIASRAGDFAEALRLARQSLRITSEIPGPIARMRSQVLAIALADAGELAAAEQVCAEGLAQAREQGDLWNVSGLLTCMARLDLLAGRNQDATAHLREHLRIALRAGGDAYIRGGVRGAAHLCAQTGRPAEAVTLDAAAIAAQQVAASPARETSETLLLLGEHGLAVLRDARQALGPTQTLLAEERGAAMSLHTAGEYALLLMTGPVPERTGDPGPPAAADAAPRLGGLSARERELVVLVAQGYTNAQIAERLVISPRTVGSHLDRIRDKTGCRRRADLTRLALSTGMV